MSLEPGVKLDLFDINKLSFRRETEAEKLKKIEDGYDDSKKIKSEIIPSVYAWEGSRFDKALTMVVDNVFMPFGFNIGKDPSAPDWQGAIGFYGTKFDHDTNEFKFTDQEYPQGTDVAQTKLFYKTVLAIQNKYLEDMRTLFGNRSFSMEYEMARGNEHVVIPVKLRTDGHDKNRITTVLLRPDGTAYPSFNETVIANSKGAVVSGQVRFSGYKKNGKNQGGVKITFQECWIRHVRPPRVKTVNLSKYAPALPVSGGVESEEEGTPTKRARIDPAEMEQIALAMAGSTPPKQRVDVDELTQIALAMSQPPDEIANGGGINDADRAYLQEHAKIVESE